jgi:hypothetical protein
MLIRDSKDWLALIDSYVHDSWPTTDVRFYKMMAGERRKIAVLGSKGFEQAQQAALIAKLFNELVLTLSVGQRRDLLVTLSERVSAYKHGEPHSGQAVPDDAAYRARIEALKNHLRGDCANWKDAVLGVEQKPVLAVSAVTHSYSPDVVHADGDISVPAAAAAVEEAKDAGIAEEVQKGKRLDVVQAHAVGSGVPAVAAVAGSTFSTNNPNILSRYTAAPYAQRLLDAAYSAASQDGFVVGIADGCGGHLSADEDRRISRAAKFAVKSAARLLLSYDEAELQSAAGRKALVAYVAREIKAKNVGLDGSTTLVAARAVKKAAGGYRLYGVAVGDSALISYNPATGVVRNLSPGCIKGWGTAMVPGARSSEEERLIATDLVEGEMVIPLTDGVMDYLPTRTRMSGDLKFTEVEEVELAASLATLGATPTASACARHLAEVACVALAAHRDTGRAKAEKMKAAQTRLAQLRAEIGNRIDLTEAEQAEIADLQAKVGNALYQRGDDFTLLAVNPAVAQGLFARPLTSKARAAAKSTEHPQYQAAVARFLNDAAGEVEFAATYRAGCCFGSATKIHI